MRRNPTSIVVLCSLMLALAGCSSYYKVTDPASGKSYYTKDIKDAGKAGAVKFKDEKSGSMVTLQSSEVKEVSGDDFSEAVKSQTAVPGQTPASPQPQAQK